MFNSVTVRCPGLMAPEQTQIMTPPPTCFTVGEGVCADTLHLVYSKHASMHYGQKSPLLEKVLSFSYTVSAFWLTIC